ncbi:Alpha-mannosidase [Sandaracinus amylolyticus]|uniref:Alpha-mannosidase n=2 Tax=Sandaracinus amylolyticus TaxID=927083 RepID=A0A0F6SE57_9BACT|nr:Alpha-mannosidase [Sandaracinus amylolyticus]
MSSMRGALATMAIASALLGGVANRADAQYVMPGAPPQYGVLQVRGGVAPDPTVADGVAGGPVSLSGANSSCRGYAQSAPSHVIMAQSGLRFLAIMVNSSFDSTLMVQTPDGQVYCNDDTDGLLPRVEISSPPGAIRVWVGAYSSSGGGPYRLGLSNNPGIRAQQLGPPGSGGGVVVTPPPGRPPVVGGITPGAPPLFGNTGVRQGFQPDPVVLTGSAGGPIDASMLDSSCRGWITPQPSHVVMAQSGFPNLRMLVSAGHDTTLVVQYPDGRIACNDDGAGSLNPLIEGPTGPGPIRVWVGSYSSGRAGPYTFGVTEYPHVGPGHLVGGGGGGVVVAPPPQPPPQPPRGEVTMVDLQPRIPVTLFGPGMSSATFAVWSPRGGPRIEIVVTPAGPSLSVSARVGGNEIALGTVPQEIARDAVVTVTQQPNSTLLVRAERPPDSRRSDPGAQMLLSVRWDARSAAPTLVDQWSGTFSDRAPRWAR